jgi:hypothetical protein
LGNESTQYEDAKQDCYRANGVSAQGRRFLLSSATRDGFNVEGTIAAPVV